MEARFDKAYYDRYYRDPDTQVASAASAQRLADFVCAYLRYLDISVDSVLDLGCGLGLWQKALRKHLPSMSFTGLEISEDLCRRHGWIHASAADFVPDGSPDLVICQGVLQYMGAREVRRLLRKVARYTVGALYLEVLTTEDWEQHCDRTLTDGNVHLRPVRWYREQLAGHFVSCGGGVFVPHDGAVLFELERGFELPGA